MIWLFLLALIAGTDTGIQLMLARQKAGNS